MSAFLPTGATVNLAVGTATARVALSVAQFGSVRIVNVGANVVFIAFGDSAVTVAAAGFPLLPNSAETFSVDPQVTHVAAIAGAAGNTLYATAGGGE